MKFGTAEAGGFWAVGVGSRHCQKVEDGSPLFAASPGGSFPGTFLFCFPPRSFPIPAEGFKGLSEGVPKGNLGRPTSTGIGTLVR